MQSIVDKQNFTKAGISIDGSFNCHNPLAFGCQHQKNPDISTSKDTLRFSLRYVCPTSTAQDQRFIQRWRV
jgi:hypothetical protein